MKASLIFLGLMLFILAGWTSQSNASLINLSDGTSTLGLGRLQFVVDDQSFQLGFLHGGVVINRDGLVLKGENQGVAINSNGFQLFSIPVPASALLMGSGLLGLGLLGWRRKRS